MYYNTCPYCGSNLDPGERCECKRKIRKTIIDKKRNCSVSHSNFKKDHRFDKGGDRMKELRITPINAESRATDPAGNENLVLTGLPIVFDMPTVINDPKGRYIEIIKRGALDGADLSDARLLYNHDLNKVPLARTPKTMHFMTSAAGLEMSAELPDTQEARSIYEAVKRGDLSGMSFSFTVPEGGSTYNRATNTRTITKIKKVYEVSIVPFPAYPQTSVEARAQMGGGEDPKTEELKKANKILFNQIMKERI